jgi:hypothetical protein
MRSKLLFLLGIIVAHGALGAVLVTSAPEPRQPSFTCAYIPEAMPYFEPQRELLAARPASPENEPPSVVLTP